jgi:hypothetical protein
LGPCGARSDSTHREVTLNSSIIRSMSDSDGPKVAQWVYKALLEKDTFELADIPYALDDAVKKLKEEGARASRWATFMHMGA